MIVNYFYMRVADNLIHYVCAVGGLVKFGQNDP